MDEAQKAGWRKVIVTLLGQIPVIVAIYSPRLAEALSPIIDMIITILVPLIIESGINAYLKMNVKQKTELAKIGLAKAALKNGGQ